MRMNQRITWKTVAALGVAMIVSATPAFAAWVGNVADVAPANTFVVQSASAQYADLASAYAAAVDNDTILVGPGTYSVATITNTKRVSLIGSGSTNDPATSSVFDGLGATGARLWYTIAAATADPSIVSAVKDLRVQNLMGGAFGVDGGIPNLTYENLAVVNIANNPADPGGWGDGFTVGGATDNLVMRNNLIDGKNAYGIRVPGSLVNRNWLIEGNELKNMKMGIVLNATAPVFVSESDRPTTTR